MNNFINKSRGAKRLYDISALPCFDTGSEIRYYGSISKTGDNADWDWGMYQDSNGEWVLAEADGAGCIFNFTQHRYPTSEVPAFRFYFDNSPTPQFEITPAEFGKKAPFLSPLADIFEGPEDNGRGPIWVVRSFVPMEFKTHCKVTSTIKLEGPHKHLGQGGWGHVTMHLYDSAEDITTFDANKSISELIDLYNADLCIKSEETQKENSFILAKKINKNIFEDNKKGTLCKISATVENFCPALLQDIFIHISFDGEEKVCAPFGTFFGCEYGKTPAKLNTAFLTFDIESKTAFFENRYPMPYFKNASIKIENRSDSASYILKTEVSINRSLCYDPHNTGYFTSSEYYPKTLNIQNKNSIIADISGSGQMVYGVITGEDIECGCEGDVRIFIDSLSSPSVESDGSESWGSYGWGFVCPPQSNPFSAYNGVLYSNNTWSELRLTFTDSYPFKSHLLFELEHGECNNGGGWHSGQVFCYMKPECTEKFALEITPDNEYYITDGKISSITDRFENGIHENYKTFSQNKEMTFTRFEIIIPKTNKGIVIKKVSSQQNGRMEAKVFVDGCEVTERNWLYPDFNDCYSLLEDSFLIPSRYTVGKETVTVEIKPMSSNWNECQYRVFVVEE